MDLLSAILPNIISAILYDSASGIMDIIRSRKSIEKRFNIAFEKAVNDFYTDPQYCGRESMRRKEDYISKLKSQFVSAAQMNKNVQYAKLAQLFEKHVLKDPFLRMWLFWNNLKYTKSKLDDLCIIATETSKSVEEILKASENNSSKLDEILLAVKNKPDNGPVLALIPSIEANIEALNLTDAQTSLNILKESLLKQHPLDNSLLAKVDYLRGLCAKYHSGKECAECLELAYSEMIEGNIYDEDILAGRVLAKISRKDKQGALLAADELSSKSKNNIWSYIPSILFSDEPNEIVKVLEPQTKELVIANLLLIGTRFEIGTFYDIKSFSAEIPESLTLNTLPIWVLYINAYIEKFFKVDGYDLLGSREATPTIKYLFEITGKYLELSAGTSIKHLIPDIEYINAYMGFVVDKDKKWLDKFEKCKCSKENQTTYNLFHAVILNVLERYDDALSALDEGDVQYDSNVADVMRCIISVHSLKEDGAVKAYKHISESGNSLLDIECYYVLVPLINWSKSLGQFVDKIKFENPTTMELFQQVNNCMSGESSDISWFESHIELYKNGDILRIIAIVYSQCGHIKEGIELLKKYRKENKSDLIDLTLFELYESDKGFAKEEYDFLKEMRNADKASLVMLNRLYQFAQECSDYKDALVTINIMRSLLPENKRVYLCYLQVQAQLNNEKAISDEIENIRLTDFDEEDIPNLFNVLIRVHKERLALEILYDSIKKYDSWTLKNLFLGAGFSAPGISEIIRTENTIVESDSYVRIKYDYGDEIYVDISDETSNKDLIGCHLKEKINTIEKGTQVSITILEIRNKYFKLEHDLMRVASTEHPDECAIKVFSADDLFKEGNPLDNLAKMAGLSETDKERMEQSQRDYQAGTTSIITLLNGNSYLADYYNKLFGDFKIYTNPYQLFEHLIKSASIDINTQTFVLDITSLILLFELERALGVKLPFKNKPIVPLGLKEYIKDAAIKESCNIPSFVNSEIYKELNINIGHSPFATRLNEIVAWIEDKCVTEVADQKLGIKSELHDNNFFNVEVESCILLLKSTDRILVSEDWGFMNMMQGIKLISTESLFWAFNDSKKSDVSRFLIKHNFIGCQIEPEFMYEEYIKKSSGTDNCYDECLKTVEKFPVFWMAAIETAHIMINKGYNNAASIISATSLLKSLFENIDYKMGANVLMQMALSHGSKSVLYKCAFDAFKMVHPVILT